MPVAAGSVWARTTLKRMEEKQEERQLMPIPALAWRIHKIAGCEGTGGRNDPWHSCPATAGSSTAGAENKSEQFSFRLISQRQRASVFPYLVLPTPPVIPPHQVLVVLVLFGQVIVEDAIRHRLKRHGTEAL